MPDRARRLLPLEVVGELAEDGVGEAAFEAAQRAFLAFAGGEFLGVVGGPAPVVPFVGERDDVQRLVQPPVPGPGQSVALLLAGGCVDGCGAVPGCEVLAAGEAVDVADVAQQPGRRRMVRCR